MSPSVRNNPRQEPKTDDPHVGILLFWGTQYVLTRECWQIEIN